MEFVLKKGSSDVTIKSYFEGILKLSKGDNQFPVDLDDVWALAYTKRRIAITDLQRNFLEGVDYIPSQNEKVVSINELQNGIKTNYKLSISCLEYLVARKVRSVFEVYRQVFHSAVNQVAEITRKDLALMILKAEEELEAAKKQLEEQKPLVEFAEDFQNQNSVITIRDYRKMIETNCRLHINESAFRELLREHRVITKKGEPCSEYLDRGWIAAQIYTYTTPYGERRTRVNTVVTSLGMVQLQNCIKRWIAAKRVKKQILNFSY